jgi:hypothetical protein
MMPVQLLRNSDAGQVVYTATADDSFDVSDGFTFSLVEYSEYGFEIPDSALSIDADTGVVKLNEVPNHELKPEYSFSVIASDGVNDPVEQQVTLKVDDLDEIAPTITSSNSVVIDESGLTGELIYTASSHDSQSVVKDGPFTQEFVRNEDGTLSVRLFLSDSVASKIDTGLENLDFDFAYSSDVQDSLQFIEATFEGAYIPDHQDNGEVITVGLIYASESLVEASDATVANTYDASGGIPFAELKFSVQSESAVNQFSVTNLGYREDGKNHKSPSGTSISEYQLSDSDSATVYSLSNASDLALSIDSETGNVYLNDALDSAADDQYSFTLTATDAAGNSTSEDITVAVNNR